MCSQQRLGLLAHVVSHHQNHLWHISGDPQIPNNAGLPTRCFAMSMHVLGAACPCIVVNKRVCGQGMIGGTACRQPSHLDSRGGCQLVAFRQRHSFCEAGSQSVVDRLSNSTTSLCELGSSYVQLLNAGRPWTICRSLRYAMLQEFILSAKLSRHRGCVRRYRYTDPGNGKSNSWTRQPRFLSFWQRAAVSLSTLFSVAALCPAHALQWGFRYLALKKH